MSVARRSNAIANRHPRAVRVWSRLHARLNRVSRGRFMPRWLGAPVLVLETVGRRSGRRRATPQAREYPGFTERRMPLIALEPS